MDNVMFDYIPGYFKATEKFKALLDCCSHEFDSVERLKDDIIDQLYVDTATWGLQYWEKEYDLAYNSELNYEERRSRIKAKIRGLGKVDKALLLTVISAYENGAVSITFDGNINITFIGTKGIPSALNELKKQLDEIVPAGLKIVYLFTYLTWNEFEAYNRTWDQWDALNLTWDQLETYKG